jgi:hypothetical protein
MTAHSIAGAVALERWQKVLEDLTGLEGLWIMHLVAHLRGRHSRHYAS